MNATKPQPARPAHASKVSPPASGSGTGLGEADAAKAAPADGTDVPDADFEQHDTIPAPTWFDDGGDASS